jgi:cytochrome c-type biogenesis protein CcmF
MNVETIGLGLIWIALLAISLSTALYAVTAASATNKFRLRTSVTASLAYYVATASLVGVCAVLSLLLMTHDFSVDYVYRYSSRELPAGYLFATFWAGQDGSFLLWAFWIAVLGLILARSVSPLIRARVMSVYCPVLFFLLLLLAVRNPFAPFVPSLGQPLHPADGIGLNPLLENPWMVVHPPTLFLGFAGLTVPFSFALAALLWGDDHDWYRRSWPWVLFTFSVLGLGVMLGGYWAYETLGWGGFWGWDPVEDGPLVPWLTTVALLHAIQANRVRGALKKSTLFLAIFGFVAALYETFLTRTGILDKFSNHSFSTLGGVANSIVLYGLLVVVFISLACLAWRYKRVRSDVRVFENPTSRDFGLTVSVILLSLCAVVICFGMSAPLVTSGAVALHILQQQSSVSPDFFNKANFPEAVLLAFGMGVGPFLSWGKTDSRTFRRLLSSLAIAILLTAIYGAFKNSASSEHLKPVMLVLFFACVFCICANAQIAIVRMRPRTGFKFAGTTLGGVLAHIGVAVILIGVIGLVLFTAKENVVLVQGRPTKLSNLPYQMTYIGMTSNVFDRSDNLKFAVSDPNGSHAFIAKMPFAVRNVEGVHQVLARPAIVNRWWGDLYFAFEAGPDTFSPNKMDHFTMHRGQSVREDGYEFTLLGYSIPPDVDAQVAKGIVPEEYPVTALLQVTGPNGLIRKLGVVNTRFKDDPIAPAMPETLLPKSQAGQEAVAFEGLDPNSNTAGFYIRQADLPLFDSYSIQLSTRPSIGLVWLGTITVVLGGIISTLRRSSENKLSPVEDPPSKYSSPNGAKRTSSTSNIRRPRRDPVARRP